MVTSSPLSCGGGGGVVGSDRDNTVLSVVCESRSILYTRKQETQRG